MGPGLFGHMGLHQWGHRGNKAGRGNKGHVPCPCPPALWPASPENTRPGTSLSASRIPHPGGFPARSEPGTPGMHGSVRCQPGTARLGSAQAALPCPAWGSAAVVIINHLFPCFQPFSASSLAAELNRGMGELAQSCSQTHRAASCKSGAQVQKQK